MVRATFHFAKAGEKTSKEAEYSSGKKCRTRIFNEERPDACKAVLSAREKEVLEWLKRGKSSWDISVVLGISERTVKFHVYNIMRKLEAVNRPQAVAVAVRLGLIDIG